MRLLNFILLLALSINVSWGYTYDANQNTSNYKIIDFELQNQQYDGTSNLCYRCINSSNENLKEKTQNGSFFTFEIGLIATKGGNKAPDFIVSKGGTAFPVPKGSTGPTSVVNPSGKTTGSAFTGGKGGANGQVDTMRIMDATPARGKSPGYPNGYVKYENKSGQGVNPSTGKTISNKESHFPLD